MAIIECGKLLSKTHKLKVLNLLQMEQSMHYNPFAYIKSEKDIIKLVNCLISNTTGEGAKSAEQFWVDAEKLYYYALVGYIWQEGVEEKTNFDTLLELLSASEVREDDDTFKNAVDLLFEDLETGEPNNFAVRQYKKFKLGAGASGTEQRCIKTNYQTQKAANCNRLAAFCVQNGLITSSVFCEVATRCPAFQPSPQTSGQQ